MMDWAILALVCGFALLFALAHEVMHFLAAAGLGYSCKLGVGVVCRVVPCLMVRPLEDVAGGDWVAVAVAPFLALFPLGAAMYLLAPSPLVCGAGFIFVVGSLLSLPFEFAGWVGVKK